MDFDIMALEVTGPSSNIDDYTWSFYGDAGIGKSSLCAYLYPDPAFFQWEQGQTALTAKKIPVDSWKTFREYIKILEKAFKEGKAMPMKTAIMDTADFAYKKCTEYVCKLNGWAHPSDGEWGKGWDAVSLEWEMAMASLENLGIKPQFIAHDKDKEFKPKKADKYNQTVPSVPTGCLATIVDKVNHVGYCTREKVDLGDGKFKEVRVIYFRGNGDFVAKSQLRYMPDKIEFGDTPAETAQRIIDAFNEACEKEFGEEIQVNRDQKAKRQTKASTPATTAKGKATVKDKPEEQPEKKVEEKPEVKEQKPEEPAEKKEATNPEEPPFDVTGTEYVEGQVIPKKVQEEINAIINEKVKKKEFTMKDALALLMEQTGVNRISQITSMAKANALLVKLKA